MKLSLQLPSPTPHTFPPTLLKICLPASTRRAAWTLQSQDTSPWPATFSFLPPLTALPPLPSSFFPAGSLICPPGLRIPCCAGMEPGTLGRVFWGQMKTSLPLRGRLLRSKARDRSKASSFLPGLRPRAEAHSPSLQRAGGSLCSEGHRPWK